MTPQEQETAIGELEERTDRLRVLYEQYFLGFEKLEPTIPRKDVDRRFAILRKEQIRNTALRFRLNVVTQKYNTYSMYWIRICRQIENGTYTKHLKRAQKRFGKDGRAAEDSVDVDIAAFEIDEDAVDALMRDDDSAFDDEAPTRQRPLPPDSAPPFARAVVGGGASPAQKPPSDPLAYATISGPGKPGPAPATGKAPPTIVRSAGAPSPGPSPAARPYTPASPWKPEPPAAPAPSSPSVRKQAPSDPRLQRPHTPVASPPQSSPNLAGKPRIIRKVRIEDDDPSAAPPPAPAPSPARPAPASPPAQPAARPIPAPSPSAARPAPAPSSPNPVARPVPPAPAPSAPGIAARPGPPAAPSAPSLPGTPPAIRPRPPPPLPSRSTKKD